MLRHPLTTQLFRHTMRKLAYEGAPMPLKCDLGSSSDRPTYPTAHLAKFPDLHFVPEYCPCGSPKRLWGLVARQPAFAALLAVDTPAAQAQGGLSQRRNFRPAQQAAQDQLQLATTENGCTTCEDHHISANLAQSFACNTKASPAGLWVRHLFVFPRRSIELLPNLLPSCRCSSVHCSPPGFNLGWSSPVPASRSAPARPIFCDQFFARLWCALGRSDCSVDLTNRS